MKKYLFILRHSKSDWNRGIKDDHSRPLNERGESDAHKMAQWMKSQKYYFDAIYCSTARRVKQTVAPIITHLEIDVANVHYDQDLYLASLTTLLEKLSRVTNSLSSILLVGHNPGLDELVSHISKTRPPLTNNGKLMTTTCLAQFEMPDDWSQLHNRCELVTITRPQNIVM